jgi:nitronate monooxygenase
MRRALAAFPDQEMANRIFDKYFIEGGKAADKPFRTIPMWTLDPPHLLLEATVLANFCEVWLAKHNDDGTPIGGIVGINRLTKVQLPTIASLYGAMLADVDYVIMGAGIPLRVPGVLDNLSKGKDATFPVDVSGSDEPKFTQFSPKLFWKNRDPPTLNRPAFVPIVSSVVLAQSMLKRADGKGPNHGIDGFVVELPTAGGHNAPPRGFRYDPVSKCHAVNLNERGEPIYGPKDEVDLQKFLKAANGVPFWLAGSFAHADKFTDIIELGGAGVQVGTAFALAQESGMDPVTKQEVLKTIATQDMEVYTDPIASPTGYPFKVLEIEDTLSEEQTYLERPRLCSLGYLRTAYIDEVTGKLGYRCPSEPVEDWVKKGGAIEATTGRKCLCNALMANVGLPQTRYIQKNGQKEVYAEKQLITIGDEVNECRRFLQQDEDGNFFYKAADVVDYLKSEWEEQQARKELKDSLSEEQKKKTATSKVDT